MKRFSQKDGSFRTAVTDSERNPNSDSRAHAPRVEQTLRMITEMRNVHQGSIEDPVFDNDSRELQISNMLYLTVLLLAGFSGQRIEQGITH